MTRPENVSVGDLRRHLAAVEGKTATLRIVVGINHKQGVPQTVLADWYGVSRATIHNWLDRLERLESEPLEEAVYDDPRPGRPPLLDDDERARLRSVLEAPPTAVGYDAAEWSTALVREFVANDLGVSYSSSRIRELVDDLSGTD